MFPEIKKLLERKLIKDILFGLLYIGLLLCIFLILPQTRNRFIHFINNNNLQNLFFSPFELSENLFALGYCTIFAIMVIYWFLFIKRNIFTTILFITGAFVIFFIAYQFLSVEFKALDLLRTPLFGLGSLFVFYVIKNRQFLLEKTVYKLSFFQKRIDLKKNAKKTKQNITKTEEIVQPQLIETNTSRLFSILNSSVFVFIGGGILGALFFIYNFGTLILNPTYTDWLMNGHDLSANYLWWELSRNYKITLPMDIIPLLFRVFSDYLPDIFQYFGLYTLTCYVLQGGFGALVVKRIGGNTLQSLIGSMFFILSTVMLFRVFYHYSLANHYILLLCILECLNKNKRSIAGNIVVWSIIHYLAYTSHPYVSVIVFLFMLYRLWTVKNMKNQYLILFIGLILVLVPIIYFIVFYIVDVPLGYFYPALLLREAQSNLNSFFNSQGLSRFIKELPHARDYQYEGNGYLGLGIILVFVFIIIYQIFQKINDRKLKIEINDEHKKLFYLLFSGIVILCLSPTITFNQYVLFSYPLPPSYEHLWSVFRSTGRFIWSLVYFIIIFCIWWIIKKFSVKVSTIILCILLIIQWIDLQPGFEQKGKYARTRQYWKSELASPVWSNLGNDFNNLFFTDIVNLYFTPKYHSYLDLTVKYKMNVISNGIIRGPEEVTTVYDKKMKETENILQYGPDPNTIYIIKSIEPLLMLIDSELYFYVIDNEVIGISSKKEYLSDYEEVSDQFISEIKTVYGNQN